MVKVAAPAATSREQTPDEQETVLKSPGAVTVSAASVKGVLPIVPVPVPVKVASPACFRTAAASALPPSSTYSRGVEKSNPRSTNSLSYASATGARPGRSREVASVFTVDGVSIPDAVTPQDRLRREYCRNCAEAGRPTISKTAFGRAIEEAPA
jgi:hypothetical protein